MQELFQKHIKIKLIKIYLKKFHIFHNKNLFYKFEDNNLKQLTDFHGTRDFYNLIKLLTIKTRSSKFNDTEALYKQALNAIDRNFSGLRGDEREFKPLRRIFKEEYNQDELPGFNIYECLKDNILDNDSRYLLLISNGAISTFLLETVLKELKKDSLFYLGSKLKDDISKREYSYNMLNKIIVNIE
jgi:hypothetical protein